MNLSKNSIDSFKKKNIIIFLHKSCVQDMLQHLIMPIAPYGHVNGCNILTFLKILIRNVIILSFSENQENRKRKIL